MVALRVGLVTPYSWTVPGGVNHHIEHLAAELDARGHETWIIAPVGALTPRRRTVDSRRQAWAEHFIPMGTAVPVPSNGSRSYLGINPRVMLRMDRALRYGRFDVLHVHEPGVPWVGLAAVFLATCPVVGTFHAALESSFGYEHMPWLGHLGMDRLDVRIAVSEAAREFPARLYPGDYRVIPNGVTVELYAPAIAAAKVKGRVLFIGRAEKRKGLRVLLEAFVRLRTRVPGASLVIAGSSRRQVVEEARTGYGPSLDLTGVKALGWVEDADKVAQLGEAEILCAPSLAAESFGIVLAEGMAAGVPVAASDLRGYRAVLRDGAAGRLTPPGDPVALAGALEALLGDEEERRRLAATGLAAAADLSWRHVTDEIITAYEDAVAVGERPGYHGLPGRPWFGRALVDYALGERRAGRDRPLTDGGPGGGPNGASGGGTEGAERG